PFFDPSVSNRLAHVGDLLISMGRGGRTVRPLARGLDSARRLADPHRTRTESPGFLDHPAVHGHPFPTPAIAGPGSIPRGRRTGPTEGTPCTSLPCSPTLASPARSSRRSPARRPTHLR